MSRVALALLVALLPLGASAAVRVHLVGGGTIVGETAWEDGESLRVETADGVVGIPRSSVARVETIESSTPDSRPRKAAAPTRGPAVEERRPGIVELAEAVAALESRDFDRAAALFHRAIERAPERPGPRVGYALSEIARGRDPMALAVVLDGLVLAPDDPELLEVLGDLRNREERVDDALRAWRRAFERAPQDRLREKIEKGERELEAGRDYAYAASAHFTIRHEGDLDRELSSAVVDALETLWTDLTGEFRHAPSQAVTVILYPDRAFRDVTQAPEEVGGIYDGKIRVPLGGKRRLDPALESVLAHELTHAIVHSKTRGHCPRWLHEGLAQRAEGRKLTRAQVESVRTSLRGGDPADWDARAFSYPASLALVLWLEEERGFSAVVSLLDRLGEGLDLDRAFESVFASTYAETSRRWARALETGAAR